MPTESSLPAKDNIVIVHYGCSNFEEDKHKVLWIGCIHFIENEKTYFYHSDEITSEERMIESFSQFVEDNSSKVFIHWSMNSPKFGFNAITRRYTQLTEEEIIIAPNKMLDLSEYLKEVHGTDYISRDGGRLDNLAKLNTFSGIKTQVIVNPKMGFDRLELIYSIYQTESQGKLITNHTLREHNPYPRIFVNGLAYNCFKEYMNLHITKFFMDISYLKRKMESLNVIHKTTDKNFMKFLFEENMISQQNYDEFLIKGKLNSFDKSIIDSRENNFNNIFTAFI